MRTLCL